jgi:hypothetical protein
MSNVLRRLFHRHAEREDAERERCDQGEASLLLEPKLVQPANDPIPVEPPDGAVWVKPASDAMPVKPTSDQEAIELQIATLISAWDKTSLCARRVFLTRIDQRIMTAHLARSVTQSSR